MRIDTHFRQLTDALRQNLELCAANPEVEAVHDTRTGTRRIEAALEAALQDVGPQTQGEEDELTKAVRTWERLLKKIRRAAAPVRDLDVQRKLLKKMAPGSDEEKNSPAEAHESARTEQAAKLDGALSVEREDWAVPLKKNAAKWAAKLDGHYTAFASALQQRPSTRRRKPDAAAAALDAFARLASRMRQLDSGNLHDFRKGAKKARYMAEAGGQDEYAGAVGRALKKLQDEIGDWHDWLMLADEAHRVLGELGTELTSEIEQRRDDHYEMAMKAAGRMRGKLMGEWLSMQPRRRAASRRTAEKA